MLLPWLRHERPDDERLHLPGFGAMRTIDVASDHDDLTPCCKGERGMWRTGGTFLRTKGVSISNRKTKQARLIIVLYTTWTKLSTFPCCGKSCQKWSTTRLRLPCSCNFGRQKENNAKQEGLTSGTQTATCKPTTRCGFLDGYMPIRPNFSAHGHIGWDSFTLFKKTCILKSFTLLLDILGLGPGLLLAN